MTCSCDAMLDENAHGWVYETKCMLNTLGVTDLDIKLILGILYKLLEY